MRLDPHMQEQIARGCTLHAGFALSRQSHDGTVAHPHRYLHIEYFRAADGAGSVADRAYLSVLLSGALTLRASLSYLQIEGAGGSAMRLLERERDLGLDILPAHSEPRAGSPACTPSAKNRVEKVAEIRRTRIALKFLAEIAIFSASI